MIQISKTDPRPSVAVIGGGISGLMCARRLSQSGVQVTVFESAPFLGGEIRTATLAGHQIDLGAEAVHLSAPGMAALLAELEIMDDLIKSNPGMSWLWTQRGLRKLPAGVGPSGPRHLRPVLRSGVMSLLGLLRAGLEPLIPRRTLIGDIGVGEYVSQRFGLSRYSSLVVTPHSRYCFYRIARESFSSSPFGVGHFHARPLDGMCHRCGFLRHCRREKCRGWGFFRHQ